MEIKEWRLLAAGSFFFLLVVIIGCMVLSQPKSGRTEEMAASNEKEEKPESTAAVQETEIFEGEEVKTAIETVWTSIEKEEKNYIKVPITPRNEGAKVYLQEDYLSSRIVLNFAGKEDVSYDVSNITRVFDSKSYLGKLSDKEKIETITTEQAATENGKKVQVTFQMKRIFESVLYQTDSAYYIVLSDPRQIYDNIVVLDAGHGGMDEGTMSSNKRYYEKDYVLEIVKELKAKFEGRDIKVYCTRTTDVYVTKKARTALANRLQADLFISVHCNAGDWGESHLSGVEALYSTKVPEYGSMSNKSLARLMLGELHQTTSLKKRGIIKRDGLYILHHAKIPATIVEVGYMTNYSDMEFMKQRSGKEKIVQGLYNGIIKALQSK